MGLNDLKRVVHTPPGRYTASLHFSGTLKLLAILRGPCEFTEAPRGAPTPEVQSTDLTKSPRAGRPKACVQVLSWPPASCVTLGQAVNFSGLPFSRCRREARTPEIAAHLELPSLERSAQRRPHTFSKGYREDVALKRCSGSQNQPRDFRRRDVCCGCRNSSVALRWGPEHACFLSFFFFLFKFLQMILVPGLIWEAFPTDNTAKLRASCPKAQRQHKMSRERKSMSLFAFNGTSLHALIPFNLVASFERG